MTLPWNKHSRSPWIIAEIGVNHDGDPGRAIELVDIAHDAGADAVKFQLFRASLLVSQRAALASYQRAAGERSASGMLARLELDLSDLADAAAHAHRLGLASVVTVFNDELVADADLVPWDAYKTASPDIVHRPLLEALRDTGRPLVVSTGAATGDEVARACSWLAGSLGRTALLQCVSAYPTPDHHARLSGIVALRDMELGIDAIGYSDHTTSLETGAIAGALGARVLEKHITYDRAATGPDHASSLDPPGFARYVALARRLDSEPAQQVLLDLAPDPNDPRLGPVEKAVDPIEHEVRSASRQSVTAGVALAPGQPIRRDALVIRRPGTGIEPWRIEEVAGRIASREIDAGRPISDNDLA